MKKNLSETDANFVNFLQIVNLIGVGKDLFDLRSALQREYDRPAAPTIEEQNQITRSLLETAIDSVSESDIVRSRVCQFLFQKPAVDKIEDTVYFVPQPVGEITLTLAPMIYENFRSNYQVFNDLMEGFKGAGTNKLWQAQSRIDLPVFLVFDSEKNVSLKVEEKALFYGFRDFKRVLQCPMCSEYFLALRTDAKFCSPTCSAQSRQDTFQAKKKGKRQ